MLSFLVLLGIIPQIDDAMMGMGFGYTSIFRPGVLDKGPGNKSFGEWVGSE